MKSSSPTATLILKQPSSAPKKRFLLGAIAVLSVIAVTLYWVQLLYVAHPHKSAHASTSVPVATTAAAMPALRQPVLENSPGSPGAEAAAVAAVPIAPGAAAAAVKVAVLKKPVVSAEDVKLSQAAQVAFNNIMDLADKYPDTYGFGPGDVLANAHLGGAIPIYTIEEHDRTSYQSGQPLKPLLKPADRWVFPVLIGDRIHCMVEVYRDGRSYTPGGGSKMLGICWGRIMQRWPVSKGYHPQLIVNPSIPGYYFTVPELETQNVTDINQMIFPSGDLSPASVILASWG